MSQVIRKPALCKCNGTTDVSAQLPSLISIHAVCSLDDKYLDFQNPKLNHKMPNTRIAIFAFTADPEETAKNEPSNLDLQCLPSHGVQRKMISVDNFFVVFFRLLFFALLFLFVT